MKSKSPHNSPASPELQLVQVDKSCEHDREECWTHDFAQQFPVKSMHQRGHFVTIDVDEPHLGYVIETSIVEDRLNGRATLTSEKKTVIAKFNFVDGIADGPCSLYDEDGKLFYEGYFKNGYRQGNGRQYDCQGNVVLQGLFDMGRKLSIKEMPEMNGYWIEFDADGQLLNVSKRDEYGRKNDICYFYNSDGEICKISKWKDGIEISTSGSCIIFDVAQGIWFQGRYKNGLREGRGKEYDDNGVVKFDGFFCNGKRLNMIKMREMNGYWKEVDDDGRLINISKRNDSGEMNGICYFFNSDGEISKISEYKKNNEIRILKTFVDNIMIEYHKGVRKYEGEFINSLLFNYPRNGMGREYDCGTQSIIYEGNYFNGKRHGAGKSFHNKRVQYDGLWINGSSKSIYYAKKIIETVVGASMFIPAGYYDMILAVIWFFFFVGCTRYIWKPTVVECVATISQSSELDNLNLQITDLVVLPDSCNNIKKLDLSNFKWLQSILIGDDCFGLVKTVLIEGLMKLKTLKISKNTLSQKRKASSKKRRSFRIINCTELESIEIGEHSFYDFGGEFELRNLPSLQSIIIGNSCFGAVTSFILNRLRSLKRLVIAENTFFSNSTICAGREYKVFQIMNCEQLESIAIGNNCFSDFAGEMELKNLPLLHYIVIGDNCFGSVKTFQIDGLNQLRCIKIGKNSFTEKTNSSRINKGKSFHILNCVELELIEIGEYSFSDYSGQFELKNLFSLRSIVIGSMKMYSSNFYYCSFVIRGKIEMANTDQIDLPNLQSITLGCYTFSDSVTTVLESIQLH